MIAATLPLARLVRVAWWLNLRGDWLVLALVSGCRYRTWTLGLN